MTMNFYEILSEVQEYVGAKRILVIELTTDSTETFIPTDTILNKLAQHNINEYDLIVFDFSLSYRRVSELEEIVTHGFISSLSLSIKWVWLTSNYYFYNCANPSIIYYPIHIIRILKVNSTIHLDISSSRPKLLCFLTRHYHYSRVQVLIKLAQSKLIDDCIYSFCGPNDGDPYLLEQLTKFSNQDVDDLSKLPIAIADITEDFSVINKPLGILTNAAFSRASINLFTEASYPDKYVTEKSVIPFQAGQLSAVLGGAGLTDHLKELGFDLFEEYVTITNPESMTLAQRIGVLFEDFEKLAIIGIEKVWADTYERRLHNYNLVRNYGLLEKLQHKFVNVLTS